MGVYTYSMAWSVATRRSGVLELSWTKGMRNRLDCSGALLTDPPRLLNVCDEAFPVV
jgi:hypothetical protein